MKITPEKKKCQASRWFQPMISVILSQIICKITPKKKNKRQASRDTITDIVSQMSWVRICSSLNNALFSQPGCLSCSITIHVVNGGRWLWNLIKFFLVCFCSLLDRTKHNKCFTFEWGTYPYKQIGKKKKQFMHAHCLWTQNKSLCSHGPSNKNLVIFVWSFDVCRAI